MRVWSIADGTCVWLGLAHTKMARAVAASLDGCLLASGSYDRTVCVWDSSNFGEDLGTMAVPKGGMN